MFIPLIAETAVAVPELELVCELAIVPELTTNAIKSARENTSTLYHTNKNVNITKEIDNHTKVMAKSHDALLFQI